MENSRVRGATFHGNPCIHGHGTLRRMSGAKQCVECQRLASADWCARNRELSRSNNTRWREANRPKLRALIGRWKAGNKTRTAQSTRKRQAAKRQRVPRWADETQMRVFYKIAAALTRAHGVQFDVDHIVPLQGARVSGLHVQGNLQVMRAVDNYIKGSKFE
jgi:hypothetical protein